MPSHQLCSVLLLLLLASATSRARDSIAPGEPLTGNQTLVSAGGGGFALGFFTPPGSNNTYVGVWYARVTPRTVIWVANRADPIHGHVDDNAGATLSVSRDDCALAVADANSTVVWSVSPPPAAATDNPCTARIRDDGNLVVTDARGRVAWQGFEHPTDTLLPGMRLGVDHAAGGKNMTLTAWTSPSDPSPSPVVLAMDVSGDPEVFLWNGPNKVWRSGPWDGVQFTGVPDTLTYSNFTFTFVNNHREVTYSFNVRSNASVVSRLAVNTTGGGTLQRWTWSAAANAWSLYWYAPKDQCDAVSPCGANGVCDTNTLPPCSCLRGFAPRSPAAWAMRDGRDGCVRETPLGCANGTDGFAVVRHAKAPDTTRATVDYGAGLRQCRQWCLGNCSCTAYANANLSAPPGRRGCVMWTGGLEDLRVYPVFGQDLYVRLAAADLDSTSRSNKKMHIIITVVVSTCALAILLALTGIYIWRTKRTKERRRGPSNWSGGLHSRELHSEGNSHGDDLDLPLLDFETIALATQDFSTENKLGEGGFGPVYKGKLEDGQEIAVKTLSKTSVQGLDEFKNEVMLIAKLQHRNLVRLIGYSICGQEKMLIYEFMENKSLDYFLFDKSKSMLLNWETRYHIIEGIARGLLYLHQDSRYRIIHRDLKTSNILLDKEMTPKISDFGMARMFGSDDTEINTIRVVGTYGYMAPEYAMDGVFSVKSDVFSFGVIVLEIISGKRNRGVYSYSSHLNLLAHAWSSWIEGNSLDLIDETVNGAFNSEEVLKCLKVGLLCVQENPDDRPLMSQVLLMLASADAASLPDPRQPGFIARRAATEYTSSSRPDCSFVDSMTITMIEGR